MEAIMLGPSNAIWDDGEWVGWHEIEQQIRYKEWGAKYPNADRSLIPVFEALLSVAEDYHLATGSHLQVYGDIGELFASITYGVQLHRNYAEGSDGKLGNDCAHDIKSTLHFYRSQMRWGQNLPTLWRFCKLSQKPEDIRVTSSIFM